MDVVNIHAAKTQFSRLLERVAQGEEVIIARAGKPVARLVPMEQAPARAGRVRRAARPGRRGLRCADARGVPGQLRLMRLLLDTHAFLWWVFDDPVSPPPPAP